MFESSIKPSRYNCESIPGRVRRRVHHRLDGLCDGPD